MKMTRFNILAAATLVGTPSGAEPSQPGPQIGDTYGLTLERHSKQESSDGSSGSTDDRWTLMERVVAARDGGFELEYDHAKDATAEERASDWQFPARAFKPSHGAMQLLNRAELEGRVDPWLKAANLTREVCGQLIFTWNAFRIECDPQTVIKAIEAYDLQSQDVHEGAPYHAEGALGSAPLRKEKGESGGVVFVAELKTDPETVRRNRAESDVAVGEMMQKRVTLEAALQTRAKQAISGTISVKFETDSSGEVRRRSTVTKLKVHEPDGRVEDETVNETLERRLVERVKP